MDKTFRLYLVLCSLGLAVLPWLIVGLTRGTHNIPVLGSICCSILSLAFIGLGIWMDWRIEDDKERMENYVGHLRWAVDDARKEVENWQNQYKNIQLQLKAQEIVSDKLSDKIDKQDRHIATLEVKLEKSASGS